MDRLLRCNNLSISEIQDEGELHAAMLEIRRSLCTVQPAVIIIQGCNSSKAKKLKLFPNDIIIVREQIDRHIISYVIDFESYRVLGRIFCSASEANIRKGLLHNTLGRTLFFQTAFHIIPLSVSPIAAVLSKQAK